MKLAKIYVKTQDKINDIEKQIKLLEQEICKTPIYKQIEELKKK